MFYFISSHPPLFFSSKYLLHSFTLQRTELQYSAAASEPAPAALSDHHMMLGLCLTKQGFGLEDSMILWGKSVLAKWKENSTENMYVYIGMQHISMQDTQLVLIGTDVQPAIIQQQHRLYSLVCNEKLNIYNCKYKRGTPLIYLSCCFSVVEPC